MHLPQVILINGQLVFITHVHVHYQVNTNYTPAYLYYFYHIISNNIKSVYKRTLLGYPVSPHNHPNHTPQNAVFKADPVTNLDFKLYIGHCLAAFRTVGGRIVFVLYVEKNDYFCFLCICLFMGAGDDYIFVHVCVCCGVIVHCLYLIPISTSQNPRIYVLITVHRRVSLSLLIPPFFYS